VPMSGITKCCVPECDETIADYANVCDRHKMPGTIMAVGESTMIVTIWVAEHEGEVGFILLNDYAPGHLFSGRSPGPGCPAYEPNFVICS
jgi:hypothetical protein